MAGALHGRLLVKSCRPSLQAWLQERQYATPYHWLQRETDRLEYQLRTDIVLNFSGLERVRAAAQPPRRLLDIGCGDGRFLADAAAKLDSVGVDVSSRALGYACRLVPSARFISCGGEALSFPDHTFDVVTLLDVIEHIPDKDEARVIEEAHRVLRHGGHFVISTNTDRSARELKHFRHYAVPRFLQLFDRLSDVRIVGLIPYVPTLRFWMAVPLVERWLRSRVRTCPPEQAQTVIGVGVKR